MKFKDKLNSMSKENNSLLCIGLDTNIDEIAPFLLRKKDDPVFEFNKQVIDATKDLVVAYKPNLAFYEAMGPEGLKSLMRTIEYIPTSIPIIGDAKRGDIGNTARAYARAVFDVFGFDAVTVNPYMGLDSVKPFLNYEDKGVFVLCRTSNPSASEFQNIGTKPLYQIVAEHAVKWNVHENCGLVVGATWPDEIKKIRTIMGEDMLMLIPGIGAQSGDLEKAVRFGTNSSGDMAIISSSRSIIYAGKGKDFDRKARDAAISLRDKINQFRYES
ncbi:MAG: orotidine-5'-phosphate decarboxylase [Methanosarcinales archaeon Met12]|nr:MAG: orotidine-5'-phosphate decarboxylase [Methanosarcinales archaeon Met12]